MLFVGAVALVKPGLHSDAVGIALLALVYLAQRRRAPDAPIL